MLTENEKTLLLLLKELRSDVESGCQEKSEGICGNIYSKVYNNENVNYGKLSVILIHYFEKWPEFSGNVSYPVPDPNSSTENREYEANLIFDKSSDDELWEGEYGKLRLELLDFIIAEMEKEDEL